MRYLGSKTSLLNDIYRIVAEVQSEGLFCDPFGGIGTVGAFFKSKGYSIVAGDILEFAHCFQVARISCNENLNFNMLKSAWKIDIDLVEYLNQLPSKSDWLVEEFAYKRQFFTVENALKIQSCIDFIWKALEERLLNKMEYCVLIASLINEMDKVANTAGTYYAYLKYLSPKAKKTFKFQLLPITVGTGHYESLLMDAKKMVSEINCDILYLDPPYNERNYLRYYHLPENIASRNIPFPLENKSGISILNSKTSDFNKKDLAAKSFNDIVLTAKFKHLIFHYTDDGIIPKEYVLEVLKQIGKVSEFLISCRAYSTSTNIKEAKHHLYRVSV